MVEIRLPGTNVMYGNVAWGGNPHQMIHKMIPKRSQSNPKMIKNDLKNNPKAIPKLYQNNLKTIPQSFKKEYTNIPKMVQILVEYNKNMIIP